MIEDGYTPPKWVVKKVVSRPRYKWDEKDFNLANLNSKAISCIINGLTSSECQTYLD